MRADFISHPNVNTISWNSNISHMFIVQAKSRIQYRWLYFILMFNYTPKNNDLLQLLEVFKSLIPKRFFFSLYLIFPQNQTEMSSNVKYLNYKNKSNRKWSPGRRRCPLARHLAAMWTFDQQVETVSWKRWLRSRVVSLVPTGGKCVATTNNITDL